MCSQEDEKRGVLRCVGEETQRMKKCDGDDGGKKNSKVSQSNEYSVVRALQNKRRRRGS